MKRHIVKSYLSGLEPGGGPRRVSCVIWLLLVLALSCLSSDRLWAVTTQKDAVRLLIARWKRVLASRPNDREARRELVDAYLSSEAPADRIEGYLLRLSMAPEDHEAKLELGEAYLEAGRLGEASKIFRELVAIGRYPVRARLGLGQVYEELKKPEEALPLYLAAWARDKQNADLPLLIADVESWLGHWARSLEFYEIALKLHPEDKEIPTKMAQARVEWERQRREAAGEPEEEVEFDVGTRIDSLLTGLIENPADGKLRGQLAAAYLEAHEPAQAHQEYLELLKDPAHRLEALLGLGQVYVEIDAPQKARVYYEKAVGMKSTAWEAHAGLGRAALDEDKLEEARMHLAEALRLAPKSPEVLLAIAMYRLRVKNRSAAREALRAVLTLDDGNSEALVALARLDWEEGKTEAAERALKRVYADDPRDYEALKLSADLARSQNKREDEIQALGRAIRAYGLSVSDYVRLGRLLVAAQRHREAMRLFLAGYRVDPDDRALVEELIRCVSEMPDASRDPEMVLLLREKLAWIFIREGDDEKAVSALEELKPLYESDLAAARRRSQQARDGGDVEGLRKALQNELRVVKGKLRLHRTLAEYHVDQSEDEPLERELRAILALDPTAVPYLLDLANLYFDKERYTWARKVFERLPETARMTLPERVRHAETAQYSGRKKNAFRRFVWLEEKDFPDDVVEVHLGDHYAERGNHLRSLYHYERALSLNSGNASASDALRWEALSTRPDLEYVLERYDDSDGLSRNDKTLRFRRRLNDREIVTAETTHFRISDRWASLEGIGYAAGFERRMSDRSDLSLSIAVEPFTASNALIYELGGRNYPSGHVEWEWSLFNRGFGETALAARNNLTHRGLGLSGTFYFSPRLRATGTLEQGRISDGNGRSMVEAHLQTRLSFIPGWVGLRERRLDFDFLVAPALYFAPDSLDRTDLTFQWGVRSQAGASFDLSYVYGKEGDEDTRHDLETELTMELARNREFNLRYAHSSLSRSHHTLASNFESDEYAFSYRMLF